MTDKMTDEQIIKALKCHIKRHCWDDCPNATEERQLINKPCSQMLAEDTLDLIKRQKTEIDILIRKKEALRDEITEKDAEIDRQDVQIMRLKHEIERMKDEQ